ncbi:MAG TPA: cytochrome c maturation protein CcmE [Gammaproteobacteria bacterium]|nr:cytochrome c maturation protein CcmE [Gammaproteobacteria bacterium]
MTVRGRRMLLVGLLLLGVGGAVALVLMALNENMSLFFSPTQVVAGEAPQGHPFRIGGLVAEGSVDRPGQDLDIRFAITDGANAVHVSYTGILPDLFREGQGIVARGRLQQDGTFFAEEVLAKHDENYMPPEVHQALEKGQQLSNPHAQ